MEKEFVKILNKKIREYHDLYVQRDKLLLADVFENFRNMRLKIYELETARVLTAPGLAWQEIWKKTKVKLDLLIDINLLLIVAKGIRGRICHEYAIHWYANANDKIKEKWW